MTLTDLLNEPSLRLRCVSGRQHLHRPVTWVHTAEVSDPGPWLSAQILLLTTALIDRNKAELKNYFASLSKTGVSAVGFGVGITHSEVPDSWIEAAEAHQIPLLRVPLETPYIAISEFVSRRRTETQIAQIKRMLDVQQLLASSPTSEMTQLSALQTLSRELDCRVVWQDVDDFTEFGKGIVLSEEESAFIYEELSAQPPAVSRSMSMSIGSLFVLFAFAAGHRLAVFRRSRFSPLEQNIIETTALFIRSEPEPHLDTNSSLRQLLLSGSLSGSLDLPDEVFALMFPASRQCAVICFVRTGVPATPTVDELAVARHFTFETSTAMDPDSDSEVFITAGENCMYAIVVAEAASLRKTVSGFLPSLSNSRTAWRAGISRWGSPRRMLILCREAHEAVEEARRDEVIEFDDIHSRNSVVRSWSQAVEEKTLISEWRRCFQCMPAGERKRISDTLCAFLSNNGAIEQTAGELGIHRQTLKSWLEQAERRLDVSLESPTDRALLWLGFSGDVIFAGEVDTD